MRKGIITLCAFAFVLLSMGNVTMASNDNVSYEKARQVAVACVAHATDGEEADASLVYQISNPLTGAAALYFFNVADKGFAIVSGCTAAMPVVGYSAEGVLDNTNFPPNMMAWLEGYASMVIDAQNEGIEPTDEVAKEWKKYESGYGLGPSKANIKLMSEKWGQGENIRPTYNLYCPKLGSYYCVSGCLPTAMAQVMHYWQFPKVGANRKGYREKYLDENGNIAQRSSVWINFNQTYYDYAQMPSVKLMSSSDSATIKATALLMFHAGVAVGADYGVDGTSAYPTDMASAFSRYFKYKTGTLVVRDNYSDYNDWVEIIRAEIDAKRPVIYGGASPSGGGADAGGHAFVCHGYQTNTNYFAINWGWDGSSDGWFNLASVHGLRPTGTSYNFSQDQHALIGLEPPDDSNIYVGIRQIEPEHATVFPAYPNPACYSVTIPYLVEHSQGAVLGVYDMSGRLVESRPLVAGSNSVEINVAGYPQGVYFYRVGGGKACKFVVQ